MCSKQLPAKYELEMQILEAERLKLEEKKKVLEDEIAVFHAKKANAELLQSQASTATLAVSLKEGEDHRK